MNKATFSTRLLPDGHLYCPEEFAQKKNAIFKVIVLFDETQAEASEHDIELSAINDNSTDFLSKEELSYYLGLEDL
ncbi:MAG: hypothetical protein HQK72_17885 [Desulfamplus sp.]|nr:hypothetical protein [Desulfamplus sp.]